MAFWMSFKPAAELWHNGGVQPRWILLLLLSAACGPVTGDPPVQRLPDTLVTINGRHIAAQKFENFVRLSQGDVAEGSEELPRRELFREFVIEQLLLQEAEKAQVTVDDSEVEAHLENWLLQEQQRSPLLFEQMREFLTVQKFIREKINAGLQVELRELQEYYQKHEEEFIVDDAVHVLEILVRDRALAEQLRGRLKPGDVRTFKDTARRYSEGSSAETGGDLGIFRRGELPEQFEKVIFSLKPGQVSQVFESSSGFHIFMMEEFIRRRPQKFYEVQNTIFDKLTVERERAALQAFLDKILQDASIKVYDPSLEFEGRKSSGS